MLKLKNTPRVARDDLVMTSPKQEQIGQHRDTHRVRAALLVPTDLMLAQPQSRFEFPIDELNRPTLLVNAHHLSRGQLRQMGHQYLGIFGAHVTPFFTQYDGDVTDITQTQAPAVLRRLQVIDLLFNTAIRQIWVSHFSGTDVNQMSCKPLKFSTLQPAF